MVRLSLKEFVEKIISINCELPPYKASAALFTMLEDGIEVNSIGGVYESINMYHKLVLSILGGFIFILYKENLLNIGCLEEDKKGANWYDCH